MKNDRKQKLVDLGPERLAETLLELAQMVTFVDGFVDRLIATPEGNYKNFKETISRLNCYDRLIEEDESGDFAEKLEFFLEDLKANVTDPVMGIELMASFFETDLSVFDSCDDSNGVIAEVYSTTAQQLFGEYASGWEDQEKIVDIIIKLNRQDSYGVRDSLIENAAAFLPEPIIRSMITKLKKKAKKGEKNDYVTSIHWLQIESLARQINDGKLFEEARAAHWDELTTPALVDIAGVYFDGGDNAAALSFLNKIPEGANDRSCERHIMLLEIYKSQGDHEKLGELLYNEFHNQPGLENLQEFLDVIGGDQRDRVISEEVALIHKKYELNTSDVEFLIATGNIDEADKFILKRVKKLKSCHWEYLYPLATAMESASRHLSASLLYRNLLLSVLEHGHTKDYSRGVAYLKKLDKMAQEITDWMKFSNHESFKDEITEAHGRKRSFWAKYEGKKR